MARSARPSCCSLEYIVPVGLFGLQKNIAFVFGVIAASYLSNSKLQPFASLSGTNTGVQPAKYITSL